MRILAAAARLAGLYAAGVLVLLVPFSLFATGGTGLREVLLGPPAVAAGGFLIGFLLLAIARRFGFGVLWILLLLAWLNTIRWSFWSLELLPRFVGWTVFAAPLYGLTAIGLGGSGATRSLVRELLITAGVWTTAVVLALKFSYLAIDVGYPGAPYATARVIAYVCGALPILVSSRELLRIARAVWTTPREIAAA